MQEKANKHDPTSLASKRASQKRPNEQYQMEQNTILNDLWEESYSDKPILESLILQDRLEALAAIDAQAAA